MIKRIDQQLRVNKLMIDYYDLSDKNMVTSKKLRQYMYNYLEIMMCVSSIMLILSKEEENLKKKDELWEYLQLSNPAMYKKLRYGLFGRVMSAQTPFGRKIAVIGYKLSQKLYGFN